jgi:membrane protease YdiL (CAAX protease family)
MRASAWFVGVLVLGSLILGCIAYPFYLLVEPIHAWPFHRVYGRLAMLVVVALLVWLFRHLRITTKRDFGYGLPWRRFVRASLLWGVVGVVSAAVGAAFIIGTGLRAQDPAFVPTAFSVLRIVVNGLGSGIAVALFEETLARGAMHTAIERESGVWAAALITAFLFALLHFFAKASIPPAELAWRSGFDVLVRSFAPLGNPSRVFDSFASYFAIGLLLSMTRVLTGNIAVAIGLHAGWVIVLRVMQQATVRTADNDYGVWLGAFDGLVGYWMLPWAVVLAVVLWGSRRRWVPGARG